VVGLCTQLCSYGKEHAPHGCGIIALERFTMKINFDTWNQNTNVDKTATTYGASGFYQEPKTGAYALDISGTVTDNNAYLEHGRSKKDVMQNFDVQFDNFSAQRDLMTVMSNIMSTEDFNKMMEDGFDPSKLEPEQVVTIVDHIKAEMAKSGQVVAGYNDDLNQEKLTEILGSTSLANEVEQSLRKSDMPVSEENVSAIKETLDKASQITELDDAGKKYMLENHLEPTVENIYRASFSAHGDGSKQSRGYFSQEMPGYYAKKAEVMDIKAMEPQIEKSLEKMNLGNQSKEESMEQAKWLISKGIPLTEQNMQKLDELLSISLPLDEAEVIEAGVNAMVKGSAAFEGSLVGDTESIYDKANRYVEETASISKEAVMETVSKEKEVTLENLTKAQKEIESGEIGKERVSELSAMVQRETEMSVNIQAEVSVRYVHAARTLAEVQLRMTIDANIRLLKSDYSIDTMPLTKLVEALKQQEENLSVSFFGKENSEQIGQKAALFTDTRNVLAEIPYMPAAVIGRIRVTAEASLTTVHTEGAALRAQYQAAGISYETLMTAPRADLGDSIRKAFSNVDDILADLGQELSEDNRKAVRILGYNNTPITEGTIEDVKATYLQVENVVKAMTPQRTLSLIREGINPLTMSLNELEAHLNQMEQSAEEEVTKYSRFLYELEKNGQITESERGAYIGIYRLFHQIEKSDGAVIGSLMNQGAELTLGNLLTAARNRKAGNMDYTIDDGFGTLTETVQRGTSISGQIEKGIAEARQAHAVWGALSVSKLQQLDITEQTTLSELKDVLMNGNSDSDEAVQQAMMQDSKQSLEVAANAEKAIFEVLQNHGMPLSAENIAAAKELFTNKGSLVKQAKDYAGKLDAVRQNTIKAGEVVNDAKADFEAELIDEAAGIINQFTGFESAQKAMETWESHVETVLQETMSEVTDSTMDVKALSLGFKQMSIMSSLRKQENYEVPMNINGELTSINLVLVHDENEKGTVSVTMETEIFGKAGVKFHVSNNIIESYFVADSEMGKERLQMAGDAVLTVLREKGMEIGETHYVNSRSQGRKEFNFLTFSQSDVDNNNKTAATTQLYEVAKTFLSGMQKAFV